MVHEIENFYGVYLLYCLNPKYEGRTYIGFTVNPNRRIQQHNRGKQAGGAKRTHGRGPWDMVAIIHGFPNMISALRFEWAWTKPNMSRRLRHLPAKKNKEKKYDYCIKVLSYMLSTGPWNRLPLTIRWLKQEYQRDLSSILDPPYHMSIRYGPVKCVKVKSIENEIPDVSGTEVSCILCSFTVGNDSEESISCLSCCTKFHTICLAEHFLKTTSKSSDKQLLPVEGICPVCKSEILWGDLIRYKRGCYHSNKMDETAEDDGLKDDEFTEWSKNLERVL